MVEKHGLYVLAKAGIGFFYYPSAKADGNELNISIMLKTNHK
jgi:hypothetical protein